MSEKTCIFFPLLLYNILIKKITNKLLGILHIVVTPKNNL